MVSVCISIDEKLRKMVKIPQSFFQSIASQASVFNVLKNVNRERKAVLIWNSKRMI